MATRKLTLATLEARLEYLREEIEAAEKTRKASMPKWKEAEKMLRALLSKKKTLQQRIYGLHYKRSIVRMQIRRERERAREEKAALVEHPAAFAMRAPAGLTDREAAQNQRKDGSTIDVGREIEQ